MVGKNDATNENRYSNEQDYEQDGRQKNTLLDEERDKTSRLTGRHYTMTLHRHAGAKSVKSVKRIRIE